MLACLLSMLTHALTPSVRTRMHATHAATGVFKTLKGPMTAVLGDRWFLKVRKGMGGEWTDDGSKASVPYGRSFIIHSMHHQHPRPNKPARNRRRCRTPPASTPRGPSLLIKWRPSRKPSASTWRPSTRRSTSACRRMRLLDVGCDASPGPRCLVFERSIHPCLAHEPTKPLWCAHVMQPGGGTRPTRTTPTGRGRGWPCTPAWRSSPTKWASKRR